MIPCAQCHDTIATCDNHDYRRVVICCLCADPATVIDAAGDAYCDTHDEETRGVPEAIGEEMTDILPIESMRTVVHEGRR